MNSKLFFPILLLICVLLAVGGCKGMIAVDSVDGILQPVLDRHDAYVTADPNLAVVERSTFLRSTELLRRVVDTAKEQ